jgi:hypothetical protein
VQFLGWNTAVSKTSSDHNITALALPRSGYISAQRNMPSSVAAAFCNDARPDALHDSTTN